MKKHYKLFILILLFGIIYISLNQITFETSNNTFVTQLLQSSNSHLVNEKEEFLSFLNFMDYIKIDDPENIINSVFNYNEVKNIENQAFYYIQNTVVDKPRVYLYSTHPNEEYVGSKLNGYDIDPGVLLASILLQEKLNEKGIYTIVEERSVASYMKENNLSFNQSYQATRTFLKDKLNEYNDFDLIIDVHRDAVAKNKTTTTIGNKEYAKLMFVMRNEYPNIEVANKLNKIIEEKYPTLSRGIYKKYIDNFNQDLNEKTILLEVGGNYNNIDEVVNTIGALANSIEEFLK